MSDVEFILDVLWGNEDNEIKDINVQEILDALWTDNRITEEEYDRLWRKYLPVSEPN